MINTDTKYSGLKFLFKIQATEKYCATLAHKTNHSFTPNAQFIVYDHPIFGTIPRIMATEDIPAKEEVIFVIS